MKNHSFSESVRHALDGIKTLIAEERNMRIHIAMTVLVICCAVLFKLTAAEKAVVTGLCFLVIGAELINTAIENAVNLSTAVFNMYAKKAKDAAAGAVLIVSIGAAICGLIIFIPYGLDLLRQIIGM